MTSQPITLFVDGACKGNPGLGGWGAYIITPDAEHKLYGGENHTTNNRMELTAAIEGISFCPVTATLEIFTDSNYVKQGITEWIHGWKKKNWKDVKNPDLWQALDALCQNRDIHWHWVKGHAGHAGNEQADALANLGVLHPQKQHETVAKSDWIGPSLQASSLKKNSEPDWLLDDPFGLETESEEMSQVEDLDFDSSTNDDQPTPFDTSHVVQTAAHRTEQGMRQLILDTETTGFYYQNGDRIVEVGAIEMINRKLTGSSIHIYINPEKPVGESENIHGISDAFLQDKPLYAQIAPTLFEYLKGAEIIAHNASFDMNFLDMEFERAGFGKLSSVCSVTDTLAMAKLRHPGQKNSLDALVRRYDIKARDRTFHGALLDAEILADVYLAMTGGQVSFDMDALSANERQAQQAASRLEAAELDLPVIYPEPEELARHEQWLQHYEDKYAKASFFKDALAQTVNVKQ